MAKIDIPDSPLTTETHWGMRGDWEGYIGTIFWNNLRVTEYQLESESSYMADDELDRIIIEKLRKVFD
jgi:hypothetical protein